VRTKVDWEPPVLALLFHSMKGLVQSLVFTLLREKRVETTDRCQRVEEGAI